MGVERHIRSDHENASALELWKLWTSKRKWDPYEIFGPDVDLNYMEAPSQQWVNSLCPFMERCEHCHNYSAHLGTIVIAVDGACRNNGRNNARASCAVYFGEYNQYSISFTLPPDESTSQRAELHAGIYALRQAFQFRKQGELIDEVDLSLIIIKADSEYLVKGMTQWIFKWKKNGYRTARGMPVKNGDLFEQLDELVEELEEHEVEVLFWHVPREFNTEADELANAALDE